MHSSIRVRLTIALIGLAIGPLLLVGVILAWQSFTTQQQQALNLQREVAQRVSTQVTAFFGELENQLGVVSRVQGLQGLERDKQRSILSELLSYQDVFEELVLLDNEGQEQIYISRTNPTPHLGNRARADEFVIPQTSSQVYYSLIWVEQSTGEPLMTIAVPLLDVRTGLVDGVLVAEARIKKVWDLIAAIQASPGQSAYIVDAQGKVVAHHNPSVVLRGTLFDVPDQEGIQPGLTGSNTVLAVEIVRLGQQELNIIAEQSVSEALALAINTVFITAVLMVAALAISGTLGFLVARQIARPIEAMSVTAQAIIAGDLSQQVNITSRDEIGTLAATFNKMVAQLRQTLVGLENRAHSLEIVRSLSDRLVYILNLTELLVEIVNQLKDKFGYYHVHIYLLDDEKKNLIVAEGTGTAGAELKARGHSIRLDASVSLVARAARTGAVVKVDNVREAQDWLPNPLLPKTCSEVAVPISLEDHVVGVLDVQADEVAALKDADADLLVTLASQVAIAIRNARLFAEVEQALTEARVAQERYLEQAWVKVRSQKRGAAYLHQRPEATPLQPPLIAEIEQDIQDQDQARVVQATGADEAEIEAVVAPIKLQNQLIGAIQLHRAGQPRSWSEQEVALVQTVAEQVAQVAENLRLFEETRQRADYERLVGEISQKLRQAPNLDSLAKIMAEELGHVLGVEHSLVKVGRSTGSAGPAELSMKQDGNNGH